jgi:sterol 24-C-methyltransferase
VCETFGPTKNTTTNNNNNITIMFLTLVYTLVAVVIGFGILLRFTLGRVNRVNETTASKYEEQFDFKNTTDETRKTESWNNTDKYYDLVTDFYLWGWGTSFHFAPRGANETLSESVMRHEYYLAKQLELKSGMKCLDIGCGVGGPMQNIARFSGAQVVGINNHEYQVKVGQTMIKKTGMSRLCSYFKSNFMKIDQPDASFDAAYAIEATCHAGDRVGCYSEILRLLKPGAKFAAYEWCMTDKYDPNNALHVEYKQNIIKGDGLPDILYTTEVVEAMKQAGFVDVTFQDLAPVTAENPVPWYQPFVQGFSFTSMQAIAQSWLGRRVCYLVISALEKVTLLPKGSVSSYEVLLEAAEGLAGGGKTEIFTPCFLISGRKP